MIEARASGRSLSLNAPDPMNLMDNHNSSKKPHPNAIAVTTILCNQLLILIMPH
jgi:hypothetical protein